MEDEVEIKIEYNDIHEEDPLSHDINLNQDLTDENCQNFCKIEDRGSSEEPALDEIEEGVAYVQNHLVEELSTATDNQKTKNDSTSSEMIQKVTWHKLIDCNKRYGCKFCSRLYGTVQRRHAFANHPVEARKLEEIISRQNGRHHKCHICKTQLYTLPNLQNHFKAYHSLENHYCHKCQAVFDNNDSLSNHLKLEHKLIQYKMYMCHTCGYKTHKVSHFKKHQNVHSQLKTQRCEYCNYSTNIKSNLRIHERIHEKSNRPYKCEFTGCVYSGKSQSALNSHKLKHNKDDHYIYCDKCTYKTVYKQSLKKHIESHMRNTIK